MILTCRACQPRAPPLTAFSAFSITRLRTRELSLAREKPRTNLMVQSKMPKERTIELPEKLSHDASMVELIDAFNQLQMAVASINKGRKEILAAMKEFNQEFKGFEGNISTGVEFDVAAAVWDYLRGKIREEIPEPIMQRVVISSETGQSIGKPDAVIYLGYGVAAIVEAKVRVTVDDVKDLIEFAPKMRAADYLVTSHLFIGGVRVDDHVKRYALKRHVGVVMPSGGGYKVMTTRRGRL